MRTSFAPGAGFGMLVLAAILAISGCGSRVIDLRDPPDPDPVPGAATPVEAVRRLQWSWNHRDPAPQQDLFTADYRFEPSPTDTSLPSPLFRESELAFATNLFLSGTPSRPPAIKVTVELNRVLVDQPSSSPGRDPRWHRTVETVVNAGIRVANGDYQVITGARFELVRGDSARIPQVLLDQGYRPDSTRWWISRWEDDAEIRPRTTPGQRMTLTHIKAVYLDLVTP